MTLFINATTQLSDIRRQVFTLQHLSQVEQLMNLKGVLDVLPRYLVALYGLSHMSHGVTAFRQPGLCTGVTRFLAKSLRCSAVLEETPVVAAFAHKLIRRHPWDHACLCRPCFCGAVHLGIVLVTIHEH